MRVLLNCIENFNGYINSGTYYNVDKDKARWFKSQGFRVTFESGYKITNDKHVLTVWVYADNKSKINRYYDFEPPRNLPNEYPT